MDAHLLSIYTPEVDDNIKLTLTFENGAVLHAGMADQLSDQRAPLGTSPEPTGTMVVENLGNATAGSCG